MNIREAINYFEETCNKLNIDIINYLNPGKNVPSIYLPFQLPEQIIEFHKWRDGTNLETDNIYSDFFPYYIYDSYHYSLKAINRLNKYWPMTSNWFPVFTDTANKTFLIIHDINNVNCPISSWDLEVGDPILLYESLASMLVSISECYIQGAYHEVDINAYEIDYDLAAIINNKYNPNIEYWK